MYNYFFYIICKKIKRSFKCRTSWSTRKFRYSHRASTSKNHWKSVTLRKVAWNSIGHFEISKKGFLNKRSPERKINRNYRASPRWQKKMFKSLQPSNFAPFCLRQTFANLQALCDSRTSCTHQRGKPRSVAMSRCGNQNQRTFHWVFSNFKKCQTLRSRLWAQGAFLI